MRLVPHILSYQHFSRREQGMVYTILGYKLFLFWFEVVSIAMATMELRDHLGSASKSVLGLKVYMPGLYRTVSHSLNLLVLLLLISCISPNCLK